MRSDEREVLGPISQPDWLKLYATNTKTAQATLPLGCYLPICYFVTCYFVTLSLLPPIREPSWHSLRRALPRPAG